MTTQFWYLHCTQFDFFLWKLDSQGRYFLKLELIIYIMENQVVPIWTTSVTRNFLHAAPNCKKLKLYAARASQSAARAQK